MWPRLGVTRLFWLQEVKDRSREPGVTRLHEASQKDHGSAPGWGWGVETAAALQSGRLVSYLSPGQVCGTGVENVRGTGGTGKSSCRPVSRGAHFCVFFASCIPSQRLLESNDM